MTKIQRAIVAVFAAGGLAWAATASAQIPFTPTATGVNNAFPAQNINGPTGAAYQVNYPYPGQCLADPANSLLFPTLAACDVTNSSFAGSANVSERTDGGWAAGGVNSPFKIVQPVLPGPGTLKFKFEFLNPPDYTPDQATFPGADYYELGLHEAWGADQLATAGTALSTLNNPIGTLPDPKALPVCAAAGGVVPAFCAVPDGMQWTGLTCQPLAPATSCSCPADASASFRAAYCPGGVIPVGYPLYTPIWGIGQINESGGPVTQALAANGIPVSSATSNRWSANGYSVTWPSISIRGVKGKPVVVKWVNQFPNTHVLCPHPDAADWPCSIDRTFMGVKSTIDPAIADSQLLNVVPEGVNRYGSPQQPDNSWVTHLHGGEIPPSTDGFAEKWFGNAVTAAMYNNVTATNGTQGPRVTPAFENPLGINLRRPIGNADTYTYPMVQEEATIWFHDHTLGKTHHNVIAGPAGFFPVKELDRHAAVTNGVKSTTCPTNVTGPCTADYTWLDPVTEPRGALGVPKYDLFIAVQDRAFNDDGSINFSNGLGQPVPLAPPPPAGYTPITNGVNPLVHPTWVPEYFGDHSLVNGALWPKATVEPGWYRLRFVDGSDSRCYTWGLNAAPALSPNPAPGTKVTNNLAFWVIANDQGYLKAPVLATSVTMCPGERYEILVNFGQVGNKIAPGAAARVFMTNSAAAPFPAGITPQAKGSPYADLNVLMSFEVNPAKGPGVKTCGTPGAPTALTWDPNAAASANAATACMPANPALQVDPWFADIRVGLPPGQATPIVRQLYLNERVDGVTLAPLGMQLNGVPFEYKVTETPKQNSREIWQFINLTVDAHPIHPHLVRHQIVSRQSFNVGKYKALLCGSSTCQPGPSPGGEMQVVPDVTPLLTGAPVLVTAASVEGGNKDATQVPPGMVTTIVADWIARWPVAPAGTNATAPGTAGCFNGTTGCAAPYVYEAATSGPYVWHCHINSHEDSEMMRTSLVVP